MLLSNIIFIPDGRLGFLSFDALLSSPVDSVHHFRDHPYLAKDHVISYNYSVRLLKEMIQRKGNKPKKLYLGMAPEFSEATAESLAPLKYNVEEVLVVKDALGGRVFSKAKASKHYFLQHQANYKILHLATHGMANPNQDDFSFLAFTAIDEEPIDQSLLYVREIYNLSTNADMVVLSACETGLGQLYEGEGIASIARSFSFAGAKSLVATRWNINDKTTKNLMRFFFTKIKEGKRKDIAMQQSINSFIKTSSHTDAHPFYWASFMAVGNMDPIDLNGSPFVKIIFSIFASSLLLILIWRRWQNHVSK